MQNKTTKQTSLQADMQAPIRIYTIIIALLVLAIGMLIGVLINAKTVTGDSTTQEISTGKNLSSPQSSYAMTTNAQLHKEINEKIDTESSARIMLEETIVGLKLQVAMLTNKVQNNESPDALPQSTTATPDPDSQKSTNKWFNVTAMDNTGLSETEILQLKSRYESTELDKLFLRDKAIREKWIGTQRYTDEINALDNQFETYRNNEDDIVYSSLLYATGQPNQVIVQDVMQNSPASLAGIKNGDQILQYSDKRIYSIFDLRSSITSGEAGEEIEVNLSRNGSKLSVYLPRGPLGIRMESASAAP